jgi:hypothetical protein
MVVVMVVLKTLATIKKEGEPILAQNSLFLYLLTYLLTI